MCIAVLPEPLTSLVRTVFSLNAMSMLHDRVMGQIRKVRATADPSERRDGDRLPFPAELVLVWNHDLDHPIRFRVIDAGDGGYRIRSSLPVIEGMTGMVLRLLPSRGQQLDQPVMVVWSHPGEDGDGFEVGLRCF